MEAGATTSGMSGPSFSSRVKALLMTPRLTIGARRGERLLFLACCFSLGARRGEHLYTYFGLGDATGNAKVEAGDGPGVAGDAVGVGLGVGVGVGLGNGGIIF